MNRGRHGETVFSVPADYAYFITLLQDTSELWNIRIAAYCLMSNHYHLLVQTPEANLSRCMRHINGLYTQYYNRTYQVDGQLFRGRFKSILVDADSYLLELVKYIHRNPLRAGIVDTVDEYVWSSHRGYLSYTEKWNWIYKDFVLSMLSPSSKKQKKAYNDLIREKESASILAVFNNAKLPAVLGTEAFIDRIRSTFYSPSHVRRVPQSRILAIPIAEIKQLVAREYRTRREALTASRRGIINEPRDVAVYLARRYSGKTLLEIGAEFNMSQYSSVSSVVSKMKEAVARDRKLRKRVEGIEKRMNVGQT